MKTILTILGLLCAAACGGPRPHRPPAMNIAIYRGDTQSHTIPLTWDEVPFQPDSNWTLLFTAKRSSRDADALALIQKTTGTGLTVTGTTATVELVWNDTEALTPRNLTWDIRATHVSTGERRTLALGHLDILSNVGRTPVTSIPVYTTDPPAALHGPPPILVYTLTPPVDSVGYSLRATGTGIGTGGATTITVDSSYLTYPIMFVRNRVGLPGESVAGLFDAFVTSAAKNMTARAAGITVKRVGDYLVVYSPAYQDDELSLTITTTDAGYSGFPATGEEGDSPIEGTPGQLGQLYIADDGVQAPSIWVCTREIPARWTNI